MEAGSKNIQEDSTESNSDKYQYQTSSTSKLLFKNKIIVSINQQNKNRKTLAQNHQVQMKL